MTSTPARRTVLPLLAASLALAGVGLAAGGSSTPALGLVLNTPLPGESLAEAALAWGDIDGDGLQDALAIDALGEIRLLLNFGEGRFEDITEISGLSVLSGASCAMFSDLDGDDRPDLFLGSSEQRVWRNLGDGTFEANAAGIDHDLIDLGAQAIDQDGDGQLDLQIHTEAGDLVYRNLGKGQFDLLELPLGSGAVRTAVNDSLAGLDLAAADAGTAIESLDSLGRASLAEQRLSRWRTSIALGSSSSVTGVPGAAGTALEFCLPGIRDAAGPDCILASSDPELGTLYPLGTEFMIAPSGDVGLGTLAPNERLHVSNPSGTASLRLDGSFAFAFMERASSGQDSMIRFQTGGADQWVMGMDNVPSANSNDFVIKRSQNSAPDLYIDEGSGEITVSHDMEMSSNSGDLTLTINSDTDNNNENDHSGLRLTQDGGITDAYVGFAAGENHLKIVSDTSGSNNPGDIILLAGGPAAPDTSHLRVEHGTGNVSIDGRVGIGTSTPGEKLVVNGRAVIGLGTESNIRMVPTAVGGRPSIFIRDDTELVAFIGEQSASQRYYMAVNRGGFFKAGAYYDPVADQGVLFADVKSFRQANPRDTATDIVYACVEGPEAAAYVRGTGTLINGSAAISLPQHFADVSVEDGMTVQVTPRSAESQGLAVVERSTTGFVVRELRNGRGAYDFDWEVKAVRQGFEGFEVVRPKLAVEASSAEK